MLEWKKRCKIKDTEISRHRIWETRCGTYKVVHSHITLGNGELPDKYYAIKIETKEDGRKSETIIGSHRKKNPAVLTCEKDHKNSQ